MIGDDLGPNGLLCHADGNTYTSKADYYRAVKAAGCEILGSKETLKRPTPKKFKLNDTDRRSIRQELAGKLQTLDAPNRPKRPPKEYFGGVRRFSAEP